MFVKQTKIFTMKTKKFTNVRSVWILFYWIYISQNGLHASTAICGYGEVKYFNNSEGKYSCEKCQRCPAGSMLGYKCGRTLNNPILDLCIPCNSDPNNIQFYSSGGYSTTCNKCNNTCGVNEVIDYSCTLSSNTRCRCNSGFYRNHKDGRCSHQCDFCPFKGAFYLKVKECRGNPNGKECRVRSVSGTNDKPAETNIKSDSNILQTTPVTISNSTKKIYQSIILHSSRTITKDITQVKTQGIHQTPSTIESNFPSKLVSGVSATDSYNMTTSRNTAEAATNSTESSIMQNLTLVLSSIPKIQSWLDTNLSSSTRGTDSPSKNSKENDSKPKADHLGIATLSVLIIVFLIIVVVVVYLIHTCKSGNTQIHGNPQIRDNTRIHNYSNIAYLEIQQEDIDTVLQAMESDEHLRSLSVTLLQRGNVIIKLERGTVRGITDAVFTKEEKIKLLKVMNKFRENMDEDQVAWQLGLHHISSLTDLVTHIKKKFKNYTLYQFLEVIRNVPGIETIVEFYKSDVLPANNRCT